ncbi:phage integrase SAM-like domain-containing protein [Robertkochia aurantiaca]|uniref:phage integrase SAM-like domain-containing protein n=1 Tax=Robertkochia aurantiaca TaxID=2873700 RepID=UPI001CCC75D0|nr:phage integrase SAM-like domain-containing protein [Robertkochia sp. 3YJGBD-33]
MTIRLKLLAVPDKQGLCPVIFDLSDGRSFRRKIRTGLRCLPEHWPEETGPVNSGTSAEDQINSELKKLQTRKQEAETQYAQGLLTRKQLLMKLKGKAVIETVDDFLDHHLKETKSQPTLLDYRYAIQGLKNYTGYRNDDTEEPLPFSAIDHNLLRLFRENSFSSLSGSSFNSYLNKIRSIMNEAWRAGIVKQRFELDRELKRKDISTRKSQLTSFAEMRTAIENVSTIYEWQAMAFYLLMFCTRGCGMADIPGFRTRNIHDFEELLPFTDPDYTYLIFFPSGKKRHSPELIRIDDYPTGKLIKSLKYSVTLTHHRQKQFIIPDVTDELAIFKYRISDNYRMHVSTWDIYKRKVKALLGNTFGTAAATYRYYADQLEVSQPVRSVLSGTPYPMAQYPDYLSKDNFRKQVERAHLQVLENFKAKNLTYQLIDSLRDLKVPNFVYLDDKYESEASFWMNYERSVWNK